MNRIYNFSAGPAILPVPVLEQASRDILEIGNSGMSILEVSHRSKEYEAVHFAAMENVLKTLGLSPETWTVLFLGGGASLQFTMVPMNFLSDGQTADYIDSGSWSSKAIKEAKRYGTVHIAGSSAGTNYNRLPDPLSFSPSPRYVHITTNNTIFGTQYFDLPETNGIPLVADMSSDIFSVERDWSRFGLLYAGAQKNAGPAGVTVVVAQKAFLEQAKADLPPMLSYQTQAENDSLYNTPPVFGIHMLNLVLQWIAEQGGMRAIEQRNRAKAQTIYDVLDQYPEIYEPAVVQKADRSLMNLTWRLVDREREKEFLATAQARRMDGLKGHRSVGGFRASIYNAFPPAGCEALATLLHDWAHGKA
ncbi:MAG: 3-phosphoserine/phosphohydroxythreonine transaminase [Armatimonadaceae bacterium]